MILILPFQDYKKSPNLMNRTKYFQAEINYKNLKYKNKKLLGKDNSVTRKIRIVSFYKSEMCTLFFSNINDYF